MNATLGKYRLIAELGRGGMGTVYLAVARGPGGFSKLVVIKQLRPVFAEDANFTAMFLEEARLAARLHHPNIVQTNEVVCHPQDGYFMVMEYLEGASLRRIVRRLRARGDAEAARALYVRAILDVLVALEYAHNLKDFDGRPLNLVHRDVNPSNVVVLHSGQVKLLDFGIAKAADSAQETRAGVLKGKLHYMPPEQMAGDKIDGRADLFAVGAMLWDALTGRKLWEGEKGLDVITSLVHGSIAQPRSVNANISEALDRICMRALSFKPADRYPDAASFRADLEKELGGHVMTNSELAAAMASEFLEEQERMRALIAEQLRTVDEGSTAVIPTIASEIPPPHTGASTDVSRTPTALSMSQAEEELTFAATRRRRVKAVIWGIVGCAAACLVGVAAGSALRGAFRVANTAATSAPAVTAPPVPEPAPSPENVDHPPVASAEPPPSAESTASAESRRRSLGSRGGHRDGWSATARPSSTNMQHSAAPSDEMPPSAAPPPFPSPPSSFAVPSVAATNEHALTAPPPAAAQVTPPPAVNPPPTSAAPVPSGSIPVAEANAVVMVHLNEIRRCFVRGEMDQLYLKVNVTASAAVAPDGQVTSVTTTATRDGTARLQACVHDAVSTWIFPQPAGGVPGRVTRTFSSE
ncbi:MAG TPA: protein kinase [Polyangiaceae bacterium]|jgi:serine/threonine-protein kinase